METALPETFSTSVEEKLSASRFKTSARTHKPAFADGGVLKIPSTAATTLTEAFLQSAVHKDRGVTFISSRGDQSFLSYNELSQRARKILSGLRKHGLKAGSRAILQVDSLPDHFATFWACVLGGIIPVTVAVPPAYSEQSAVTKKLFNVWQLLESPTILASIALVEPIRNLEKKLSKLEVLCVDDLIQETPCDAIHPARPNDVVFYQLTSGSTSTPKCVQETHRGIIAHIHGSGQFNRYSAEDITLNWLPLDHVVPMLTCHLKSAYLGASEIQVKTDYVLADPLRWLDLLQTYQVTHTWSPNFGLKLVAEALAHSSGKRWNLSSLKFMMNAGEQVTRPMIEHFLQATKRFGLREQTIQPAFGMAEVCTCMTYENNFDLQACSRRFAKHCMTDILEETTEQTGSIEFISLGPPIPGVQIRIADAANDVVPEGKIGRLQIKGTVVTPGYLHNKNANAEAFVGDGWFNTGDLGFILDGKLFITGREKEMIIIRGANFFCHEIEDILNRIEGVEPAYSAACSIEDPGNGSEGLAIFFVPKSTNNTADIIAKIRQEVVVSMGITPSVVVPLEKGRFPKTTSGKIQRTTLQKAFQAGDFNKILTDLKDSMARSSVVATSTAGQIAQIWRDVLKVPNVGPADNFFALGGDSLRAFQILSRIGESFGVELPIAMLFDKASTVTGMADCLAKTTAAHLPARTEIQAVSRNEKLPLSFSQQRLWILDQLEPGTARYNVARGLWLNGPLDVIALERSLNEIVKRHEIFRTVFSFEKGDASQVILPELLIPLELINSRPVPIAARQAHVSKASRELSATPFDLTKGPLLRAGLFQFSDNEHFLILCFHQIVIDGWSVGVLFKELSDCYRGFTTTAKATLPPLPIQYADFARWQRGSIQNDSVVKQLVYWKKQLTGRLPVLKWPSDRDVARNHESETETIVLSKALSDKIKALSRREGATLFMTLLSAYKALLRHLTSEEDILVGSAVSGRNRIEIEKLIGFFVNTIVLRSRLNTNQTFRDLLAQVRRVSIEAFANTDLPFEKLVEELRPDRRNSNPVFQAWFSMMDAMSSFNVGDLTAQPVHVPPKEAQFDFSLFVIERPDEVELHFEYKTDLFSRKTVSGIIYAYERFLQEAAAHPEAALAALFEKINIPPLTQSGETIHSMIEQQALAKPDNIAVSCGSVCLTYAELNRRANQLAHHLKKSGVGPESFVGLCTDRSVETAIGILAVLKAGAAYVPLDLNYPKERLQIMLDEIKSPILLTVRNSTTKLPTGDATVFCLDSDWSKIESEPETNPVSEANEDNLAYVIFTSGSTGKPKGVLVTHKNLVHSTKARFEFYPESVTAYLMISSFSFDSSVAGIFWTLCSGGNLVLPTDGAHQDPQELIELLEKHRVSHFLALPSLYNLILQQAQPGKMASLKAVIVAGESCPPELVERHAKMFTETSLYNEYGPTEGTVWCTVAKLNPGAPVTIGRAIPNARIHILDETLLPVPPGAIGEIFVGGPGIARGYLNRPDITAQKFIPDHITGETSGRLYRTGDLARTLPDGNIAFLGRSDNQIKIRGHRIELEEIESALREFSGIQQVAVIAREQPGTSEKQLAGYIVTISGQALKNAELRSFLQTKLPEYMVPATFVFLQTMPLTPNGKVDRNALSAIKSQQESAVEFVAPRTPVEEQLAAIWTEVLRVEKVGIHDNFFDLGGHSLLAIQVGARIRERLNVQVPVRHIFETPTISALGEIVFQELIKSAPQR